MRRQRSERQFGPVSTNPNAAASSDRDGTSSNLGTDWLSDLLRQGRLTPKGRVVAQFIAGNPRLASFSSASDLGERVGVNVATVVRFAQNLGFRGWPDFQLQLRHNYLGSLMPSGVMRNHLDDVDGSPIASALHRDLHNLEATIESVDVGKVEGVAAIIAHARRTLIISAGSHAAPGLMLAHLGHFMGYDIQLETRGGVHVVAALSTFEPGDCVITINFWRVVKDITLAAQYCRRVGITTVAITDSLFSPLAQASDYALAVPTEGVSFFQSLTAAMSLVHGLLAQLQHLGGQQVEANIERLEQAYVDLDVLYR